MYDNFQDEEAIFFRRDTFRREAKIHYTVYSIEYGKKMRLLKRTRWS